MPPKKANEPSKKTAEKAKQKIIEDKTFGLKNKKGAKQQQYIAQVQKQVTHGGQKSARELEKLRLEKEAKKAEKKNAADELTTLFKPVTDQIQKIGKDVDPKSVLCAYFKQGLCKKGDKCKFSHDLNVARRSERRNMFDSGEGGAAAGEGADECAEWDQEQLEKAVNEKHGLKNKSLPATTIICKYFLEAVENNKYGWFWECPTGEKCHYRHALPEGFVLKRDQKKMEEQKDEISLEDLIEKERNELSASAQLTPVTWRTFVAWKRQKRAEQREREEAQREARKNEFISGQAKTGRISGREMFEFNPDMIEDDDDDVEEGGLDQLRRRGAAAAAGEESGLNGEGGAADADIDFEQEIREINFDDFMEGYEDEADEEEAASGSAATSAGQPITNGLATPPPPPVSKLISSANAAAPPISEQTAHIDENLFDEAILEDLEIVD